ncbi:hypothetical protein CQ10_04740 [Bradyrhizobium valentinum]|uniref:Uncharacterized protein n=1 Tax=Bradyrhizobium valentinum TaxID=1518501 RepID=A0A0R3LBF0_9BRAD|nr:hypothetical protein CQ10_04740 [Bradyrhizobium valentinum]KRR05201.1 hypothetical protein CP49_01075 [Bradyrhizobium valentinum]
MIGEYPFPGGGSSAADDTLVRIFLAASTGRGTDFALAEFTLAAAGALFHCMRKQGLPGFIWYSIGLGAKPSSEWPPQEKDGRHGAARRHEAAGRM